MAMALCTADVTRLPETKYITHSCSLLILPERTDTMAMPLPYLLHLSPGVAGLIYFAMTVSTPKGGCTGNDRCYIRIVHLVPLKYI